MGMALVYFDIKGYGQVSFHTFHPLKGYWPIGVWDGKRGGSQMTCYLLNKKLNLQVY